MPGKGRGWAPLCAAAYNLVVSECPVPTYFCCRCSSCACTFEKRSCDVIPPQSHLCGTCHARAQMRREQSADRKKESEGKKARRVRAQMQRDPRTYWTAADPAVWRGGAGRGEGRGQRAHLWRPRVLVWSDDVAPCLQPCFFLHFHFLKQPLGRRSLRGSRRTDSDRRNTHVTASLRDKILSPILPVIQCTVYCSHSGRLRLPLAPDLNGMFGLHWLQGSALSIW